jgi:hypothetical protein
MTAIAISYTRGRRNSCNHRRRLSTYRRCTPEMLGRRGVAHEISEHQPGLAQAHHACDRWLLQPARARRAVGLVQRQRGFQVWHLSAVADAADYGSELLALRCGASGAGAWLAMSSGRERRGRGGNEPVDVHTIHGHGRWGHRSILRRHREHETTWLSWAHGSHHCPVLHDEWARLGGDESTSTVQASPAVIRCWRCWWASQPARSIATAGANTS